LAIKSWSIRLKEGEMSFLVPSLGRAGLISTRVGGSSPKESLISIYRLS
jgi:hypothetical protein